MSTNESWLTLNESAARARCHPATLRREIRLGRCRAARLGGRKSIRIKAAWIDEWLLASTTPVESARP